MPDRGGGLEIELEVELTRDLTNELEGLKDWGVLGREATRLTRDDRRRWGWRWTTGSGDLAAMDLTGVRDRRRERSGMEGDE